MDVRTDINASIGSRLPGRRQATASAPAPLHLSAVIAEIFKKTSYAAGSKPGGRDVAKDMFEAGDMPLPMTILRDHEFVDGVPCGERLAVTRPGGVREKRCHADS